MILREYRCKAHGDFEAWDDGDVQCPSKGCQWEITQVFTKAPGMISRNTRNKDVILKDIAKGLNATDMSNKDGNFSFNKATKGQTPTGIVRDEVGKIIPSDTYGIDLKPQEVKDPKTGRRVKTFNPNQFGVQGGAITEGFRSPLKSLQKHLYVKPAPEDLVPP